MKRRILRLSLAAFYLTAGIIHLSMPEPFLKIMPPWVPAHEAVVLWTGLAEIAGAIGMAQPFSAPLRKAAAVGLAIYAVCVFPANIHHFELDLARPGYGLGLAYHVPRMVAQPVIVWLALWAGEATNWPWSRRIH